MNFKLPDTSTMAHSVPSIDLRASMRMVLSSEVSYSSNSTTATPSIPFYYIEKGRVDLFLFKAPHSGIFLQKKQNHPFPFCGSFPEESCPGINYFFSSFEAGKCLFPFPTLQEECDTYYVIAIATENTTLRVLYTTDSESTTLSKRYIAPWTAQLSHLLTTYPSDTLDFVFSQKSHFTIPPHKTCILPAGTVANKNVPLLWLSLKDGGLSIVGMPGLPLSPSDAPFPLSPYVWVQSGSTGANITTTSEITALLPSIFLFNDRVLRFLIVHFNCKNLTEHVTFGIHDIRQETLLQNVFKSIKSSSSIADPSQNSFDKQHDNKAVPKAETLAEKISTWKQIFSYIFKTERNDLYIALLATFLGTLTAFFFPPISGALFNHVVPYSDLQLLYQLITFLAVFSLSEAFFKTAQSLSLWKLNATKYSYLELAMWRKTLLRPLKFFRQFPVGKLYKHLNGIEEIASIIDERIASITLAVLCSFLYLFLLFFYSPLLSTTILLLLGCFTLISYMMLNLEARHTYFFYARQTSLDGKIAQIVSALPTIRNFNAENAIFSYWARFFLSTLHQKQGYTRITLSIINEIFLPISYLTIFLILYFIGEDSTSRNKIIPLGSYIAFNTALTAFYFPILQLQKNAFSLLPTIPIWKTVYNLLRIDFSEENEEKTYPDLILKGNIAVSHLHFQYNSHLSYLHKNISFKIEAGEFIAFVGDSQSGKSSLVKLLLGFETPEQGNIEYDGVNLCELNLPQLRKQIGVVLQEENRIFGSIREYLCCERNISDKELMKSLELACFDTDLAKMPLGLDTNIPKNSALLSLGQRQRLNLARALAGLPKILILDEATYAIDAATEKRIFHNLDQCYLTRIVITQRLSTLKKAHRIYVLDKGGIVESGTFEELSKLGTYFGDFIRSKVTTP